MTNNVDNTVPQLARFSFVNKIGQLKVFFSQVLNNLRAKFSETISKIKRNSIQRSSFETSRSQQSTFKKYLPYAIIGVFVLIALGIVGSSVFFIIKNWSTKTSGISLLDAKAREELNKELSFPIYDAGGKEVSKIKYVIQSAELRDELIVKGQRARSVQGRTFLILNLKLTNDFNQSITINTKDYVRLSVNGKDEWVAPEIHNDPVEVQAISTKSTRVGYAVNNSDKNLRLKVGEINGSKEEIKLSLN